MEILTEPEVCLGYQQANTISRLESVDVRGGPRYWTPWCPLHKCINLLLLFTSPGTLYHVALEGQT